VEKLDRLDSDNARVAFADYCAMGANGEICPIAFADSAAHFAQCDKVVVTLYGTDWQKETFGIDD
jgi:hypothetical protein